MRTRLLLALLLFSCKREPPPAPPLPPLSSPERLTAFVDLKSDLAAARAAIAAGKSPVYAIDRMAVAARELGDERDSGVLALLAEAETVRGLEAPLAWAQAKLAAPVDAGAAAPQDCQSAREMLNRIDERYTKRSDVADLLARFRARCGKIKLGAPGRPSRASSAPSGPDPAQQRSECKSR